MNAIQSPTQSHALCACDDPAFKAQIAGLQAMTKCAASLVQVS